MKEIFIGSMDAMKYFLESVGFKVTREYIHKEKRYRFIIELHGASYVGFFTYPDKDGLSPDKKSEIMREFCVRLINSFWSEYLMDISGPIARRPLTADENTYINNDIASVTTNAHFRHTIEKVIFNDPATIVFWSDGTKTVVKTQNGETFDPEKGLAMAMAKRAFGNKGNYYNHISKWVDQYNKDQEQETVRELKQSELDNNIAALKKKYQSHVDEDDTSTPMDIVSNLITDMILRGATKSELVAAVRHSRVVIDAEKHKMTCAKRRSGRYPWDIEVAMRSGEKLSKTEDEKPMTFKEKLQKEHPEEIEDHYFGGCAGCPYDYGYMENTKKNKACHQFSDTGRFIGLSDETCTKCWNRVIPKDSEAK